MSEGQESIDAALAGLEAGRQRVAMERDLLAPVLARLYEQSGEDEAEDLEVLERILADWHSMIVRMADLLAAAMQTIAAGGENDGSSPSR
jgi:hypothetical protein